MTFTAAVATAKPLITQAALEGFQWAGKPNFTMSAAKGVQGGDRKAPLPAPAGAESPFSRRLKKAIFLFSTRSERIIYDGCPEGVPGVRSARKTPQWGVFSGERAAAPDRPQSPLPAPAGAEPPLP